SHLVYAPKKVIQIRAGQNNWWAKKIRVDEAGLYVPKVTYGTYKNDSPYKLNGTYVKDEDGENVIVYPESYLDYYLIPVDENVSVKKALVEANLNSETLIGTVACTDPAASDQAMRTKVFDKINFDAGEYYVVFKPYYVSPITEPGTVAFASSILTLAGNITLDGVNCIQELYVDAKTDLDCNEEVPISIDAFRLDGTKITDYQATYSSSNTQCAVVSEDGVIKGVVEGEAVITVTVSDGVGAISKEIPVTVMDKSGAKEFLYNFTEKLYVNEKLLLDIDAVMNSKNVLDVPAECVTYEYDSNSGIIKIADGVITAIAEGEAEVKTTVDFRGLKKTFTNTVTVITDDGKTAPTLYTNEMRENMWKNIAKYDWAKNEQKNKGKAAEKLLPAVDVFLDQIYGEGIPRTIQIGVRGDDQYVFCRYCHERVGRGFKLSYTARPWKIQCSYCKRLFPSNDFESFLELGLDESGLFFDVARAREAHHKMLFHKDGEECTCEKPEKANTPEWYVFYGYGNPEGYLYNELYSEIRESNEDPWGDLITWNKEKIKNEAGEEEIIDHGADLGTYKDPETGKVLWQGGDMWGVDDGWGYLPGRTYADGLEERHGYVAFYNHAFWGELYSTVRTLADGYLYTEDVKYGRAGALLLDRVANVLPSFNMYSFRNKFLNVHGGSGYGAVQGRINDSYVLREFLNSADILFPMIEDEELIGELSADAEARGLENDKTTPEKIWKNWEEGIVLAAYDMLRDGRINGNFGQAQGVAGLAAIVIGKQPETNDILNWVYATDAGNGKTKITGGNFESTMINRVDRDGMGDEASPRYNTSWVSNLSTFADAAAMYKGEGNYQPFSNPKFIKMYTPQIDILLLNSKHPNVGDAGSVASVTRNGSSSSWFQAFSVIEDEEYKKKIANYIYTINGNKTTGYRYDIFTENPEGAEEDIMKYVDTEQKQESTILTGYGIAILRDGAKFDSANAATAKNNMRDIWVYFGRNSGHGHNDTLNLGMDAYGLDIAPDLGYPEATSYTPNRLQWVEPTISHNTVTVNEANHDKTIKHGYPLHFDETETVKLIDVDASNANSNTEKYRRSVVMIKANDDVSYAVDFFRVTGGNTHTYSFHSQAENAYPVSGIELTDQKDENGNWIGTYAGVDGKDPETGEWIEYGPDPNTEDNYDYSTKYPRGYTWMNKIRRDKEPEQNISVEFDVQDYNKILTDGKNIKLRLTQMNNFTPDEVAIVGGYVPIKSETEKLPRTLDYLLVHNRGENLDSLFTTVLEPYKGERYVSDIKTVGISVKTGTEIAGEDMARAVKVAHTNGRCDYVVYATNNDVIYTVNDTFVKADGTEMPISFDFSGFVGVYTVNENGACIYRYVNDGTVIGEETEKTAAYTGTVTGFQKGYEIENYIDVEMQCDDLSDLAGKVIYVDNDRVENGAYRILSASREGEGLKEGSIRLDIGTVTLIRSHIDKFDFDKGYVYNIKEEQTFTIPTSFEDESLPEFEPVSDTLSTSAGSSISVTVKATSPIETDTPTITYIGATLPRGASLNSETGVFTWKPTDSQVGDNHVAITARDSDGRETTIHFDISVYGNTTGSGNKTEENSGTSTENAGTAGGGGGGGGGGGAAPTDKPDDETKTDENDNGEASGDTETGTGETAPDASGETDSIRFTDLSNHTWAADAINTLADDGIIRGTASDTYSP
ncbi:MAG: heparinase II/III family protein, partial [Oscillospiraceae bacterium]|nr:heparinase II/III family protein [Oscillospiraceae bacterium]